MTLTMVLVAQVAAHPVQAQGRACFQKFYATCYTPAEAAKAAGTMAIRPVDPTSAVRQATHLPLRQVVVERMVPVHVRAKIIFYSFGTILPIDRPMPRTSHHSLFVTEFVLPKLEPATVKSQPGTIPSVLATFPHRKLALLIGGHFPLPLLHRIALAVLHQSR